MELRQNIQDVMQKNLINMRGASESSTGGPGDEDPDEEEYKTKDFKKNDKIGLKRFTKKGKNGRLIDPKTRQYIEKDRARNSGSGGHGGSHWKLFDKSSR